MKSRNVNKIVPKKMWDFIKIQNKFLNNVRFNLDRIAQGLFLFGWLKLDYITGIAKFSIPDLEKKTKLNLTYLYDLVRTDSITSEIFSKLIYLEKNGKNRTARFIITDIKYNIESFKFELEFNKKLLPLLEQIQNNYTLIDLKIWRDFKSKYTLPLYLLIKKEVMATPYKEKNFTIHELKQKLHIYEWYKNNKIKNDLYPDTSHFLQKVIYPAFKEINQIVCDHQFSGFKMANVYTEKNVDGKTKLILNKYDSINNPNGIVNPATFKNLTFSNFKEMQKTDRILKNDRYRSNKIIGIKLKVLADYHNYPAQKFMGEINQDTSVQINTLALKKRFKVHQKLGQQLINTELQKAIDKQIKSRELLLSDERHFNEFSHPLGALLYDPKADPLLDSLREVKKAKTPKEAVKILQDCLNQEKARQNDELVEVDDVYSNELKTEHKKREFKDSKNEGDLCPWCKDKGVKSKLVPNIGGELLLCNKCRYGAKNTKDGLIIR